MNRPRRSILLLLSMVASCATPPAPVDSDSALSLRNPHARFAVQVWSESPTVLIGDYLNLTLRTTRDSYVSLYAIHSSGRTSQLVANHPLRAAQSLAFPGPNSSVDYRFQPPTGTETYIAVATHQPLSWLRETDIAGYKGPLVELNLTGSQLVSRLRLALEPYPPPDWNADVINLPLQPYRIKS